MATQLTPESLPTAIRGLFELNNYSVEGPLQIHGAEVDLLARPKGNPFGASVYIEATVEYVDNDKYGKDLGKLAMIRELEPDAQLLIVSTKGFSLPVKERAEKTRILTFTYLELFAKFEQFEPYLEACIRADTTQAHELAALNSIYEEPFFDDKVGVDSATAYLNAWRTNADPRRRWLIVVGEYGTGKTALTKVLQYRWLHEYLINPTLPIPFRIELRDFTRQFDARGLIHHFLDHNGLGHVPIDFVFSLIRSGRIVMLLDGYDEMAQYLSARAEDMPRSAC
jgi:NACHT domain-containing protein